jgi:hypothetical protein
LLGHANNGEALLAAKKYAEAVVAFEAGLLLDPTDAVCQQGLQRSKVWYNVGIINVITSNEEKGNYLTLCGNYS